MTMPPPRATPPPTSSSAPAPTRASSPESTPMRRPAIVVAALSVPVAFAGLAALLPARLGAQLWEPFVLVSQVLTVAMLVLTFGFYALTVWLIQRSRLEKDRLARPGAVALGLLAATVLVGGLQPVLNGLAQLLLPSGRAYVALAPISLLSTAASIAAILAIGVLATVIALRDPRNQTSVRIVLSPVLLAVLLVAALALYGASQPLVTQLLGVPMLAELLGYSAPYLPSVLSSGFLTVILLVGPLLITLTHGAARWAGWAALVLVWLTTLAPQLLFMVQPYLAGTGGRSPGESGDLTVAVSLGMHVLGILAALVAAVVALAVTIRQRRDDSA